MFPRRPCPRCGRSITMNRDGMQRSHFCPHYTPCEIGRCGQCVAALHNTPSVDGRSIEPDPPGGDGDPGPGSVL